METLIVRGPLYRGHATSSVPPSLTNEILNEKSTDNGRLELENGTSVEGEKDSLDAYIDILRGFGADFRAPQEPLEGGSSRFLNVVSGHEFIALDRKTGRLSRYVFSGETEKGSSGQPITKESAIARANELLRALGIEEFSVEKMHVVYDSDDDEWVMTQEPEIDGIPGGGITQVCLADFSGRLRKLGYRPQIIPHNREVRISSDQAIDSVKEKLGFSAIPVIDAKLRIVNPNNAFEGNKKTPFSASKETQVCWVITLNEGDGEEGQKMAIFVDANTGVVCGGFW